jgi:ferredoxin-nitrite reductase
VGNHLAEAVDIGMGGSLGAGSAFIDWVEHARPVNDVPDALLRVVRRYQSERRQDEPFYNWARRTPNDDLRRTLGEEGTGTPVTLTTKSGAASSTEPVA